MDFDQAGDIFRLGRAVQTTSGAARPLSTCMTVATNPNFPRPFLYTAINAPYFIVSALMTSVILVVM